MFPDLLQGRRGISAAVPYQGEWYGDWMSISAGLDMTYEVIQLGKSTVFAGLERKMKIVTGMDDQPLKEYLSLYTIYDVNDVPVV